MEVYKLPDVHGEYSLDYCTKNQDNTIDFPTRAKKGTMIKNISMAC